MCVKKPYLKTTNSSKMHQAKEEEKVIHPNVSNSGSTSKTVECPSFLEKGCQFGL